MKELYEKIYIKSADDLPKDDKEYEVCYTDRTIGKAIYDDNYASTSAIWWINKVSWYLLPINEPVQQESQTNKRSDEDILFWADTKERRLTSYHQGLQAGAKAMRDGLIKPNK